MSRNFKVSAALVALFAVVVAAIVLTANTKDDDPPTAAATTTQATPTTTTETAPDGASTPDADERGDARGAAVVVGPDPRTLGRPGDGKVTFTEFLDFECPACGAAYPLVEQLRREYEGRVTFNIRYFPLPSHRNAMPAALAVEAAAQQGKLVEMYAKLFETQPQWGDQPRSQATTFRTYARELGLDMARYDADVRSRTTRQRVRRDLAAAEALELPGTPSFFVNEQPVTPESPEHLRRLLDAALAGQPLPAPTPDPDDGPGASNMTEA